MKKPLSLWVVLFTLFLTACDIKNEVTPIPNETVPPPAIAAVRQAFPTATTLQFTSIELNRVWQANFTLPTARMLVYVNNTGTIYEASQVTGLGDLPATVRDYVQQKYPTGLVLQASTIVSSSVVNGYKVAIQPDPATKSDVKTVVFDTKGAFLIDAAASSEKAVSYLVGLDDLPPAAKAVLTGYTIVKVLAYSVDGKSQYHVLATKGTVRMVFIFDVVGTLLKSYQDGSVTTGTVTKDVVAGDLPNSIKEYLIKNYAGWTFVKGTVRSENGQVVRYIVAFAVGTINYSAEFDGQGKLLSVKKL